MLDEYIDKQKEKNRKRKQEYLIEHILNEGYNPEAFSDYLLMEREEGQEIDNWTIEELETHVTLFKRFNDAKTKQDELAFKLESFELNTLENQVYANKIKTAKKKKTIMSDCPCEIVIEDTEVKNGGIFVGRYLEFTVCVADLQVRVKRTEEDFKWLTEYMYKEFPFTPLPPLLRPNEKSFDNSTLLLTKKFFELYLNECCKHPELRHSLALEIFLASQTKAEMTQRMKDIQIFFDKSILIGKAMTKKTFDGLNTDVIKLFPTSAGQVELKISPLVKNYIKTAEGQYYNFGMLFDKLEKLQTEADSVQKKLTSINSKIKATFIELQRISLKFNSSKPFRNMNNLIEDTVFSSISSYYDNLGRLIRKDN